MTGSPGDGEPSGSRAFIRSGSAPTDVEVPAAVAAAADGRTATIVWVNEAGGRTLQRAAGIPPADKLVVCHGDACAPNTLLAGDGTWSGHVDLGLLGTADRWADLAVATWSAEWNFGPGWEELLLDAYGIQPDPDRTRYYRLLWDLSS